MINNDNLKEMMDIYVKNGEAKTKELKKLGFHDPEISKLMHERNVLERLGRGSYKVNTSELFKYACKLIDEDSLENAYNVLYRCHLDDKENIEYVYNLFMVSVLLDKYTESVYFMRILLNDTSKTYNENDINFYFSLLGLSKKLPKELIDIFKYVKYENIQVLTGNKYNDIPINRFRSRVINGSFQNIEIIGNKNSLEYRVQSKLVGIISKLQQDERDCMYDFVKGKKLEETLEYLKKDLSYRNLNKTESYFVQIINDYFEMERTKKMPILKSLECSDIWEALDNNNYRAALRIQREHCERNGFQLYKSQMYLLLEEINEMIDAVKIFDEERGKVKNSGKEIKKEANLEEKPKVIGEVTLENILEMLLKEDINSASNMIDVYLKDNEYRYLVNYLIKISVYEEDKTFSKPMIAISMMKSKEFKFVLSEYILSFYECLGKKKFNEAGVYLDILDKAERAGHTKVVIKGMRDVLNNAIKNSEDKLSRPNYDYAVSSKTDEYSYENLNTGYTLEEFIDRGIILIDSISINNNYDILKNVNNLDYFAIKHYGADKIVLIYKEKDNDNRQDYLTKLIVTACKEFLEGDYENAFNMYKDILKKVYAPNSSLFYRLGEICFKLGKNDLAQDYFLVSKVLNSIENVNRYVDIEVPLKDNEVIEPVRKTQEEVLTKKEITPEEQKRKEEVLMYYGFDIDEVVRLVVQEKMNLLDACNSLNLWKEEYYKCALYLAREYYYLGDHRKGNLYFNLVATLKNKPKFIEEFYNQVNINRKFYCKQELEGPRLKLK